MDTAKITILFIIIMAIAALTQIVVKIIEAKKNDGVITPEELADIGETARKAIITLATKILNIKDQTKMNPNELDKFVDNEIKVLIKDNCNLTNQELELLERVSADDIVKLAKKIETNKK